MPNNYTLLLGKVWKTDALSLLFFNFALEYSIMRVQVIQDGLKLKWYAAAFGFCRWC
jgi:hypothetical protein